ncbi:methyltransferase family protein [Jatrophihabitans sp. GAS493]|uniref:class I SAM-dependent methyltransferase n=1 Tax=Jatrophihabitans sp. GAS493 TaxID=1907575 RepID=UPI000BB71380|nr:class I SAM-dependent methyltransferase [Jatrophihabitans sp. GAS493]SOD71842.1 methyltransferase family protein [Jatrophihabitans sp. GAS493]
MTLTTETQPVSNELTPEKLDAFADEYYLNAAVADVDIEEMGQERSLDRTLAALHGAERVLEMGFGTGLVTGELLARGVNIEVVEGSPRLAQAALEKHAGTGLVVHTAMFEEFTPAEPYDAVLALHIAEHVDDPVALFSQIRTWLRPGGALIVMVPNAESLHRRLAVRMGFMDRLDVLSDRDRLVGHLRVFDFDMLGRDLNAAGFSVTEQFGYQLKTVPNSMMLDWPQELIAALIDISPEIPPAMLANIGVRAIAN